MPFQQLTAIVLLLASEQSIVHRYIAYASTHDKFLAFQWLISPHTHQLLLAPQVVFSYIWGGIFFDDHLTWFGVTGSLLVACGVFVVSIFGSPARRGGEIGEPSDEATCQEGDTKLDGSSPVQMCALPSSIENQQGSRM